MAAVMANTAELEAAAIQLEAAKDHVIYMPISAYTYMTLCNCCSFVCRYVYVYIPPCSRLTQPQ